MEKELLVPIRDNVADEALMFDHMNMETKAEENGVDIQKGDVYAPASEKGEGSSVVFSREGPLVKRESILPSGCNFTEQRPKSILVVTDSKQGKKGKSSHEKKLSRQDRFELGRLFQGAVSSHDWELADSLIALADPQTLNDALCITLDSIWFLSSQQELHGITGLIKNIIVSGAYDFTRAALRTSFLASCVSACQSRTMSLADTVTVMAQRCSISSYLLHEFVLWQSKRSVSLSLFLSISLSGTVIYYHQEYYPESSWAPSQKKKRKKKKKKKKKEEND